MKSILHKISIYVIRTILVCMPFTTFSQNEIPKETSELIGLSLNDAQKKLESSGYEIAASSYFGKKQSWWNQEQKVCISLKFKKNTDKTIESISGLPAEECIKGVEASRKVWEKYHDGKAPVNSTSVENERHKLEQKGYQVSYWIQDVSSGRSAEYWFNTSTEQCWFIAWENQDQKVAISDKCEKEYGKNPAPKK